MSSHTSQEPLWRVIVERLPVKDAQSEWYTPAELAPLLGLQPRSVLKHCRDLWPGWEGHYRLDYDQAVRLIRRVCQVGKNVPDRRQLSDRRHTARGGLDRRHAERRRSSRGGDAR